MTFSEIRPKTPNLEDSHNTQSMILGKRDISGSKTPEQIKRSPLG
jgi:hypothetical protein